MNKLLVGVLALLSVPAMAQDRAAKYDKDGDNKVSFAELSETCEVSKSLFEIADKNEDGVLSNKEMREARAYLFRKCNKEEKNA
jgi:Ca2+-binding EF-hand superfamily protein